MEIRDEALGLEHAVEDLEAIDQAGALRHAAEALLDEAQTGGEGAAVAQAALSRLYAYAVEAS